MNIALEIERQWFVMAVKYWALQILPYFVAPPRTEATWWDPDESGGGA